jgi:hypothetical protein
MATVILSGWFGLGTGFGPAYAFQEVSGGSYARVIVNNAGTYQTGTTQTITTFVAATTPVGLPMRLGGIFDAATPGTGNLLAWFEMPFPLTPVGTALPSTTFNIALSSGVIGSLANGGNVFQAGSQIGTINGAPLIAGVTLIGGSGGSLGQLTYEPAQGTTVTNPIIMVGGVPVARFDSSGNLFIRGTYNTVSATTTITGSGPAI